MTKTKIAVEDTKAVPVETTVVPLMVPPQTGINQPFNDQPTTCWYVWGILSTIFCCFPCGVIGLVHTMIAKHEGERGNFSGHRRRLYQAKCWVSWSIALGLLTLIATLVYWGIRLGWFERSWNYFCGTQYIDDYDSAYYQSTMPPVYPFEEEIIVN